MTAFVCDRENLDAAANAEPYDKSTVSRDVCRGQVVEQSPALADHGKESTPRVVVMLVSLEVLGKRVDSCRQKGDLHFRRTCVAFVGLICFDYFVFLFFK